MIVTSSACSTWTSSTLSGNSLMPSPPACHGLICWMMNDSGTQLSISAWSRQTHRTRSARDGIQMGNSTYFRAWALPAPLIGVDAVFLPSVYYLPAPRGARIVMHHLAAFDWSGHTNER